MSKNRRNKRLPALVIGMMLAVAAAPAQSPVPDSVYNRRSERSVPAPVIGQALVCGTPLVIGGALLSGLDKNFRELPEVPFTVRKHKPDYYLQFAPAVTLLGMKTAGVKSATPWAQMLVADAFAVAAMAGSVQLIKHVTNEMRPDMSDSHSFPSGHTATAFMTATMLHHEYGEKYPWLGALGYATAATTGYLRVADDHHWVSDAVAGAGIGIISTEIGYLLSDIVFRRPLLRDSDYFSSEEDMKDYKPSYFGFYATACLPLGENRISDLFDMKVASGCSMGVEGAYFLTKNIGVGAKAGISDRRVIVDDSYAQTYQLDCVSGYAGAYLSLPLGARVSLGAKALAGYARYSSLEVGLNETGTYEVPASGGFATDAGVSLTLRLQRSLSYSLFCEYETLPRLTGADSRLRSLGAGAQVAVSF